MADERQPLLRNSTNDQTKDDSASIQLPEQWSLAYRWTICSLLCLMAFTVTFTCIGIVPVANLIVSDLNGGHSDRKASVILVTIWELGEAAGPLFIAPLSEMFGRYPVFNAANMLFICGIAITLWSESVQTLIFARFLTGCAVASNVLNPAIIGDIFPPESRGSAMSVVMLAPLIGGAVGPAVAGAIAESAGWRRIIWMALILAIVCEVAFLTIVRETYKVAILRNNHTKLLIDESGDENDAAAMKAAETKSKLWTSITRPMSVLYSSVVLQMLSLHGSIVFTFFYVMSTTLPDILQTKYNFPPSLLGTSFLSFSIGSSFGIVVCNLLVDRIYKKLQKTDSAHSRPEARLPLNVIGAFTLPLVVALYGWAAQLHLPVAIILLAVVLLGFCLILSIVPMMAYVVDAFSLYSASAMTAVLITRCLMGTFLPLVTAPLSEAIGYGWAFTVLAAVCLVLAPIPLMVLRYGEKWRQKSVYTKDE